MFIIRASLKEMVPPVLASPILWGTEFLEVNREDHKSHKAFTTASTLKRCFERQASASQCWYLLVASSQLEGRAVMSSHSDNRCGSGTLELQKTGTERPSTDPDQETLSTTGENSSLWFLQRDQGFQSLRDV